MLGFEANNCRLCVKVFCCVNCRKNHESKVHQVVPDCDLCVYGQFSFITIDDNLLLHIKNSHLPLKCLFCLKFFSSIEEVLQRKKCSAAYLHYSKEDSPKTPFRHQLPDLNANDQDSPILNGLQSKDDFHHFINLATSTPMQRTQEQKLMAFDKSNKEPLTPVDRLDKPININKSIIKKANSLVKCDSSSKRRVTFGEPSECNSVSNKPESGGTAAENIKNCDEAKNSEDKDPTHEKSEFYSTATPSSASNWGSVKEDQFYSAKSVIQPNSSVKEKVIKKEIVTDGSSLTPVCAPSASRLRSRNEMLANSVDGSNSEAVSMDINSPLTVPVLPVENPLQTSEHSELKKLESEVVTIEDSRSTKADTLQELNNSPKVTELEEKRCNEESPLKTTDPKEDSDKENYLHEVQTPHSNTLWISALSPTDSALLNEKEEIKESPPRQKANSLAPTPIMKRTDIQMKFNLPSHFASTPIMSTGLVKLRQTEMIGEMTTQVMGQPTPFKTPQGRIFSLSRVRGFESFDTQAGTSQRTAQHSEVKLVPDSSSHQETYPLEKSMDGVSVSSMTESSLWSSMTRVMKSVYESFTSKSLEHQPVNNKSMSIKRQISEPDADVDFLEGPRLKRFKFTDIKCRRPIRSSRALVPTTTSLNQPVASLEIIKSVSMFYKGPKVQCDKATQTDDYLMYGYQPSS